jgi:hypothetical protein
MRPPPLDCLADRCHPALPPPKGCPLCHSLRCHMVRDPPPISSSRSSFFADPPPRSEGSCPRTCPLPHARNTRRPCSIFTSATCATRSFPPSAQPLALSWGEPLYAVDKVAIPPPWVTGIRLVLRFRRGPSTPFCPSMVSVRPSVFLTQPPHPTPCGCVGPQYPTQWSTPSVMVAQSPLRLSTVLRPI